MMMILGRNSLAAMLLLLLSFATEKGVLGWSWRSLFEGNSVAINNEPTVVNSKSIEDIIHGEKRYVLYNSRRLTGECLPICYDPTSDPTTSPVEQPVSEGSETPPPVSSPTSSPTRSPRTGTPTGSPTGSPRTGTPTGSSTTKTPTGNPTTDSPTENPTSFSTTMDPTTGTPTTAAPVPTASTPTKTSCECDVNDEEALTFKCGKDMYICPGVDHICSVSPAQGSKFYDITQEQCDEMKTVGLGEKCVPLPQYGITDSGKNGAKGLSHRDCYSDFAPNGMKEDGSCDICKNSFPYSPGAFSTDNFALP